MATVPKANVQKIAILGLRGRVVFPHVRNQLDISSEEFHKIQSLLDSGSVAGLGIIAAKPAIRRGKNRGVESDLFEVGTLCRIVETRQHAETSKERIRMILAGTSCFKVLSYDTKSPVAIANVEVFEESIDALSDDPVVRALVQNVQTAIMELVEITEKDSGAKTKSRNLNPKLPTSGPMLCSIVGATLGQLSLEERQKILETFDVRARLELVLELLIREAGAVRISGDINSNLQRSRDAELKKMVLQRQMQEIQKELKRLDVKVSKSPSSARKSPSAEGNETEEEAEEEEDEPEKDEVTRLSERLEQAMLPEEAMKIAKRELKRLKNLQSHHPEYTSLSTYLELMASLPWQISSQEEFSLEDARQVLDADHRGLEKVKVRIMEFLAVQKLRGTVNGPILCFHGPPGIGKTSLGRSVARALGRKFHRIALGGVKDEAELRGHRRTYIGSIPGSIIQAFQNLGVNNPVILLDEVDKLSQNAMFNPQAALLEILDPEQNNTFKDHYLNTAFDLSKVVFICTANDTSLISRPLLDRMEVVELSGYTVEEKVSITTTHLLPKQCSIHALDGQAEQEPRLALTNEAITSIITRWTAESGVRNLERRLAQICRWAALRLQNVKLPSGTDESRVAQREASLSQCGPDANGRISVDVRHLPYILGIELLEPDIAERLDIGVAIGLSVSSFGGQLLFVEAAKTVGTGQLTITGQLGSVMTESVQTAMSLLRSRFIRKGQGRSTPVSAVAQALQSRRAPGDSTSAADDRDPFKGENIHVHFPAGAIPKDGPSAGVAVVLALASLLMNRPIRSDTAVTGEVTLRGHVLPVGGIRDKVLAAHRGGVKHVLLPMANKRNAEEEIQQQSIAGIEIHYMKHVDEALDWAFGRELQEAEMAALADQDVPMGSALGAQGHQAALWAVRSRL